MDIKKEVVVVVSSCDKYSDLWDPFFKLFFKFWKDCPFNVYLISDKIILDLPRVKVLTSGSSLSWSETLINVLTYLDEDYIFLILEDLFLIDYVNSKSVLEIMSWAIDYNVNYLRLYPSPKPDIYFNNLVGVIKKGSIYRASTIFSLWKKEVLLDLLRPGENAWEFEIYGSERSDKYDSFYCTWDRYFKFVNGVVKGKWDRRAINKLLELGVEIDLSRRKVMSLSEQVKYEFKEKVSIIFKKVVPSKYRRRIRKLFKRDSSK
uniref:Glycosyltransferase family 2 protein n=1 Tax=Dictyoglomus thermophilum TaxID=14 RepID=A0A7C3MPT4_DICTH